jgi:hypothetical protein
MTRKSRREVERAIDELTDDQPADAPVTDRALGVTAPFVTYEHDVAGPEAEFDTVVPGTEDEP